MIKDLIDQLSEPDHAPADDQAVRAFTEACRRADTDPREKQRVRDIADLAEADGIIYDQAIAAVERRDYANALPLLRRCAAAGIGDSAWYLAVVLDEEGDAEAARWYAQAARDGDPRALAKLAEITSEQCPADSGRDFLAAGSLCQVKMGRIARRADPPRLPGPPRMLVIRYDNREDFSLSTKILDLAFWCPAGARGDVPKAVLSEDECRQLVAALGSSCGPWHALPPVAREAAYVRLVKSYLLASSLNPGHGIGPAGLEVPLLNASRRKLRAVSTGRRARDAMLPLSGIPACTPDATIREVLDQMLRVRVNSLPVFDGNHMAGAVTMADIADRMHRAGGLPSIQRIESLLRPVPLVSADMLLPVVIRLALDEAADNRAGLLVVTDPDGSPCGYLTAEALLDPGQAAAMPRRGELIQVREGGFLQAIDEAATPCK
jgi:CBS domain-containing protein